MSFNDYYKTKEFQRAAKGFEQLFWMGALFQALLTALVVVAVLGGGGYGIWYLGRWQQW